MADQQEIPKFRYLDQAGQHLEALDVHEVGPAHQFAGIGGAIPPAAIDQGAQARRRRQFFREFPPGGDAAQAFVQKNDGWRLIRPRAMPGVLQAHAVDVVMRHGLSRAA